MLNQYLTNLTNASMIPYLIDPLLVLTDTNRFFNPNQYLPLFNSYLTILT